MTRPKLILIVVAALIMMGLFAVAHSSAAIIWDFENPPAQPPTIAEVEAAGGLLVGDKLFSGFVVTATDTVGTVAPGPDAIALSGVQVIGDYGVRFNGGWSAGGQEIVDTTIKFKVEIVEPWRSRLWLLHDNALWITAVGVSGEGEGGSVSISENVFFQDPYDPDVDPQTNPPVAYKFVYYRSEADKLMYDDAEFALVPEIWVIKNIVVNGGDMTTGSAHLSEFWQTFSQFQVPEPATMGLLALGFTGLALKRRRRRRV